MENGGGFIPRIGADRRRFLLVVRLLGKWRMEESFIPQISRMDADFIVGGTAMKMENGGGFCPADRRGFSRILIVGGGIAGKVENREEFYPADSRRFWF